MYNQTNNANLEIIKSRLKRELSIEAIHKVLDSLPVNVAREVIESFSDHKIRSNVNMRKYQEDYISEYLVYLWETSPASFWKHTKASLNKHLGILWGGDMEHLGILCKNFIPIDVLKKLIKFLSESEMVGQDKEALSCVIKAQILTFNRSEEIEAIVNKLPKKLREKVKADIVQMTQARCNFYFGY